jgi:hypothetical protein
VLLPIQPPDDSRDKRGYREAADSKIEHRRDLRIHGLVLDPAVKYNRKAVRGQCKRCAEGRKAQVKRAIAQQRLDDWRRESDERKVAAELGRAGQQAVTQPAWISRCRQFQSARRL